MRARSYRCVVVVAVTSTSPLALPGGKRHAQESEARREDPHQGARAAAIALVFSLLIAFRPPFAQTMDAATPTPERIEISTMKLDPDQPGRVVHITLSDAEVRPPSWRGHRHGPPYPYRSMRARDYSHVRTHLLLLVVRWVCSSRRSRRRWTRRQRRQRRPLATCRSPAAACRSSSQRWWWWR